MKEEKLIRISKNTHKRLYALKIDIEAPTLDDTINYLLRFAPRHS